MTKLTINLQHSPPLPSPLPLQISKYLTDNLVLQLLHVLPPRSLFVFVFHFRLRRFVDNFCFPFPLRSSCLRAKASDQTSFQLLVLFLQKIFKIGRGNSAFCIVLIRTYRGQLLKGLHDKNSLINILSKQLNCLTFYNQKIAKAFSNWGK